MIEEEPDFTPFEVLPDFEDSLVQLIINIGAVSKGYLEQVHYGRMEKIINYFRSRGKDIILRIVYDHEGHASEREPAFFANVLEHAGQVSEFLDSVSKEIFVFQGLLVGNWGEMHSSRFVDEDKLRKIEAEIEKGRGQEMFMAVRKPVQWRRIRRIRYDGNEPQPDGLGLFNDGMFGSDTDLGTYSLQGDREEMGWSQAWCREAEIAFQNHICRQVPNGGEALYDEAAFRKNQLPDYINELTRTHITYLNREHDKRILDYWKKEKLVSTSVWNGESLFDYIGAHLGYRFIIRSAALKKCNNVEYVISVTIENTGFANIYRACSIEIEYQGKNGVEKCIPDFDLRSCESGTKAVIRAVIAPENGNIYISAKQLADGKTIYFANADRESERIFLGAFEK
ncbi:MAG: DUF4832 domain-containing protein [Lachnospiraceae bacterium]|nr:DUF4832 domain-containing protein [Lachnospiraceae bacterium]